MSRSDKALRHLMTEAVKRLNEAKAKKKKPR